MAGNRDAGFWDAFSDDSDSGSRFDAVEYGNIHPDFHRVYEDLVDQSFLYSQMNQSEKEYLADEWRDLFESGGNTRADMDAWFHLIGLTEDYFDYDSYAELYDSIYG